MEIKKGIPVSPGYAIGEAFVLDSEEFRIPQRFIREDEVEGELARFQRSVQEASEEVQDLAAQSSEALGPQVSEIFKVHRGLLADPVVLAEVTRRIRVNRFTAEYATTRAFRKYVKAFRGIRDEYFADRATDIRDIEKRLLRKLLGARREELSSLTRKVIIAARDLTPSQAAALDREKVMGFVTDAGGPTSHTAIVAKAMEIPAVVGLETITADLAGGDTVIVDGNRGLVIVGPDPQTLVDYQRRADRFRTYERRLAAELRDLPAETLDGHSIKVMANIDLPEEVGAALARGAEGVGLFRTEFLYERNGQVPTEEEHYRAYRAAVEAMGGFPLTVRTLDLGGDKVLPVGAVAHEPNPFLGCRSIRFCFLRPDIFKAQLRAILRASAHGRVRVMFPMIANVEELRKARSTLEDCMEELRGEGVPFDRDMEVGMMVEVPSAALCADLMARECDFLSIGTNDLVQYTLAVDRVNERVASLYQPASPALIRLMRDVVHAGARNGCRVSMCGEMCGDATYAPLLLGMGLRELSITPTAILEVKRVIRTLTLRESVAVARRSMAFATARQTDEYLRERVRALAPSGRE
ncbi:MAG: phosphoenolpyruvate--protein phosphotransferase [Planctomycetes bacterium]|nr:phosphoenolpyruvate--protein phosphotransferase [Planctomycetota bacterium]